MKYRWIYLILVFFFVVKIVLISCVYFSQSRESGTAPANETAEDLIYFQSVQESIDSAMAVSSVTGKALSPAELFDNDTKRLFVYRISRDFCDSCTDFALYKFTPSDIASALPGTKCLIFADYPSGREINILMKKMEGFGATGIYLYEINEQLPMEAAGMPYYFILDENLSISDAFICSRVWNKECDRYMEKLKNKYARP